jgi:hypothetical protein
MDHLKLLALGAEKRGSDGKEGHDAADLIKRRYQALQYQQ